MHPHEALETTMNSDEACAAARLEAIERNAKEILAPRAAAQWRRLLNGLRTIGIMAGVPLCLSLQAGAQSSGQGVNALESRLAALEARVAALESANAAQSAEIAALQAKTQHISVAGGELFITGTNLHVVNGFGATSQVNGKGNLIVGYNQLRNDGSDDRTGSHNIVAGDFNNYSSFGGFVAGFGNNISGVYASVSGGNGNTASGSSSSVSGGRFNTASFHWGSVSGGEGNTASQLGSSISGGFGLTQAASYGWSGGSAFGFDVQGNFRSP
jgi:hypothetical protein